MLFLRYANESDLPLIMAWRSNPLCYAGFYQQKKPLRWEEHYSWWHSRNKDWREFMIVLAEGIVMREVGIVTIGQLDHWSPEIGYYIGEVSLWGKGFGKEAVSLALDWLKEHGKEYCHTTIMDDNERSIQLIKSLRFEYLGKAREGESWYQRRL